MTGMVLTRLLPYIVNIRIFRYHPHNYTKGSARAGLFEQGTARPEKEIEISALAWPGLKRNTKFWPGPGPAKFFFSNFGPDSLVSMTLKSVHSLLA